MMLCDISNITGPNGNAYIDFAATWLALTLMGGLSIFLMSGTVFYAY